MRVLAIDGGGIRGLIPALVLSELERRADRRTYEMFDLIAGTSTGGILACALCAPDPLPASELVKLYDEEGPKIFERSLFQRIRSAEGLLDEKYDDAALDRALERFLSHKRLSETKPDLLVPAYDMAQPGPYFFKTTKARETPEDDDFRLSEVARATSAAPTYFEPLGIGEKALVDGGVFATNPAMCALAEVLNREDVRPRDVVLLSLGTGERTHKRTFDEIKGWGLAAWAQPILNVVFDGVSDAVNYQLERVLTNERYWRIQTELTLASDDLDDAGEKNLADLRRQAEELVTARSADLDAVLGKLQVQGPVSTGPRTRPSAVRTTESGTP
jgi:patatin-like phospholipase/acyl hydrolase